MIETSYYQRHKERILNRAKLYCENDNEVSRKKARNKYRKLSGEEKNMKREYGRNRDHNMSKEEKQRLKQYKKIIVFQKVLIYCINKVKK